MRPYKVLSHTADVKLQVFGHTKEELFQNAVLALNLILLGEEQKKKFIPQGYEKIVVQSKDLNLLLVGFLNEILTRSEINKKVYERIKFLKFSKNDLEAQIFGRNIEKFKKDIKAVTYHKTEINENKRGIFEVILTLDI
ncbi:MAG: archease [Patescibacteria group bacterium]|nr:archease [Patescibacteria group bacterium]